MVMLNSTRASFILIYMLEKKVMSFSFFTVIFIDCRVKKDRSLSHYLYMFNIPGLLEILDVNIDLHTGSLRVEGEKLKGSNIYNGKVAGSDLVFLEAPLFANLLVYFLLLPKNLKMGG